MTKNKIVSDSAASSSFNTLLGVATMFFFGCSDHVHFSKHLPIVFLGYLCMFQRAVWYIV